ncbi:MAG: type II toxin-antitoxin system HicA family toxin [Candidatus Sungbacteria bacterium]|uniref:Type II toxin-antitoxin system HicA family toxin n=1 Tax=Candidatus Sungiibacteriota bacterium TaxID=2750080 RepID=A0A932YYA7_9BACT|nr:type II toxin-antitoxin system HicA family toxin [Candidatus Sungbacteria bacterium]
MRKSVSGKHVIRALCRSFGFFVVSQRGSHVKLRKRTGGRVITTIVPTHTTLALGTLRGILELAEIDEENFWLVL